MSDWFYNRALGSWFHPAGLRSENGPDSEPSERETMAMIQALPMPPLLDQPVQRLHLTQAIAAAGAKPVRRDELQTLIDHGTDEDRRLVQLYLTDPYYSFEPRPDAIEEFDQQTGFVNDRWGGIACCIAGNASGKSMCGAFKAAHFLRTTPPPTDLCKYFIASQTFPMVGALWQEKLSRFIPESMVDDITYFSSKENHPRTVIMKPSANGNRWMLLFRSYEQGRRSFQAVSECAGYWLDEQIKSMALLSEIDTRTRECNYPGSKIYTLTPLEPDEELEERFQEPERFPFWKFYRMNAEKNFEAGGLANLDWLHNSPEDMRKTRRIGDFMQFSGAVFKEFDQNVHVITPRALSPFAKYFRCVDFGYSVDTHVILFAEDDGKTYVVKEWYEPGLRVQDKVNRTLQEMPGNLVTYGDPEDAQQIREWGECGIQITRARKSPVSYGIELVRTKLSRKELLFFSTCRKVISQFKNYRWKEPNDNGEDLREERPVKRNDHGVDVVRMLIHSRERRSETAWEAAKLQVGPVSRV